LLSYKKSISLNNDTYEAQHPDLYAPNRQVFLDGMLQSTRLGNEAYHEALVHPGMFTHKSPKRVAIIGGGEGATLREVLKHETVQHVKMIEIDCIMIQTSREFLPTWNTCKDIKGSTDSCFDDPRADVLCEDALSWFMDRYSSAATIGGLEEDKFDVIIMDAL
jgi:spermidine synthase